MAPRRYISSCPKGQVRTARPDRGVIHGAVPGAGFDGRKAGERGSRAERIDSGLVRSRYETTSGPPTSSFGRFRVRGIGDVGCQRLRPSLATLRRVTTTSLDRPPVDARPASPAQDWRRLLAVFWLTSMVEGLGVSQIFALLPSYLRQMGVPQDERLAFVGLFSALIFVVGHAPRAAVGRVGRQVQPEGRDRPERADRGGRLRRCRVVDRAVAARGEHAADRLPARGTPA